jgi:hypothetical protein
MDLEPSIEFLIENAARHEVELQRMRELIEAGIKLVITSQSETNRRWDALLDAQLRTESQIARLAEAQTALANAQAGTGQRLQKLIDSLDQHH